MKTHKMDRWDMHDFHISSILTAPDNRLVFNIHYDCGVHLAFPFSPEYIVGPDDRTNREGR